MIYVKCDSCGKDCERVAYFVEITPFQNFTRYCTDGPSLGTIGDSTTVTICQDCLKKHKLVEFYGVESDANIKL